MVAAMKMVWRNRLRVRQVCALCTTFGLLLACLLLVSVRVALPSPSSAYACPSNMLAGRSGGSAEELALYFRPRPKPVTPVVSRFLLQPHPRTCSADLDLLVLVPSRPDAEDLRDVIRTTWGSVVTRAWPHAPPDRQKRKVGLVFVLGQGKGFNSTDLRREADSHGDLLVGDFLDSYRNLTLKMLAGLNWVATRCPSRVRFVLKADLDVFVHVDLLLDSLQRVEPQPLSRTMLGELLCAEVVQRDETSKVHVDRSLYPFPFYPPYVRGGSYVLTGDLVPALVNDSRGMPLLPVEDAYLNGVLARNLHVQHVHLPRVMGSLGCPISPCVFVRKRQLTTTNVGPAMMRAIWRAVQQGGEDHCSRHSAWWEDACLFLSPLWS